MRRSEIFSSPNFLSAATRRQGHTLARIAPQLLIVA